MSGCYNTIPLNRGDTSFMSIGDSTGIGTPEEIH